MAKAAHTGSRPLVLRGSLIVLKRRCGKHTCHCAKGEPHATPALSYSVASATKILTLRQEDRREVEAALARYAKRLAVLEREALAGITALRKRIESEKAEARRRRR